MGRGRKEDRLLAQPVLDAAGRHGGAARTQDPLTIKAFQYDLVCNGYEIASGGIRNHLPETMVKAFEIAGLFAATTVEERFGGLYRAFQYGAPPHGGMAAGIDRIVMLLCGREEPARDRAVPDEPAGARPADGRAERGVTGAAARTRPAHRASDQGLRTRPDGRSVRRIFERP